MIWEQERSRAALDGLMVLARVAVRAGAEQVPAVVVELMEALEADATSGTGDAGSSGGRLGDVATRVTPDQAGQRVGLSGRHVRSLCARGLVRSDRIGTRYVVDLDDLHRYLGSAS